MNIAQFYSEIRASLARGTTLDSEIPLKAKQALRKIERNHSLKYMERFGKLTTLSSAECTETLALPSPFTKSIIYVRQVYNDAAGRETYRYLKKRPPGENVRPGLCTRPEYYWQLGYTTLQFDKSRALDEVYQLSWYEYTDWPLTGETDDFLPWILEHAADLLIAETLILFAPRLRDPRMVEMYNAQKLEALSTLLGADDEANFLDEDNVMGFGRTARD